ncbi:hypothetical protein HPB47_010014 [Ixodes persulcatus]|uniref:Uncharacterized protein n=1 Tax=Ixodes persulcatus TaxID=34615 RepID=A0AC60P0L3_IXOPE|nr:hypothetical protein HPB47_010014 [Ixodes persulcatus]
MQNKPRITKHEVSEYIEAPTRCFKCQVTPRRQDAKCKKCAQPHLTRDCPGETAVKCANCGGDHPADYVNCKISDDDDLKCIAGVVQANVQATMRNKSYAVECIFAAALLPSNGRRTPARPPPSLLS